LNDEASHIDLFDRYLRDELSPVEKSGFEKRLTEDTAFAEAFRVYNILVEGIRDHGKQELKNYLKAHGKVHIHGSSFWQGKTRYAAAAAVLLAIGVFAVITYYIRPNGAPEMALENLKEEQALMDTSNIQLLPPAIAEAIENKRAGDMESPVVSERELRDEVYHNADAAPESLASGTVEAAPVMEEKNEWKDEQYGKYKYKSAEDIFIAEEKKLKDTTLLIPVLWASFDDEETMKTQTSIIKKNTNDGGYAGENRKKTKSMAKIPANASNNANMGTADDVKSFKTDSISLNSKPTLAEKDKEANGKPMHIEYWQSPVNFRGYKYIGNTIQIYGLASSNVKLYIYNNIIYLKTDGIVYELAPCEEGCAFKTVSDKGITDFIIKQN